MKTKLLLLAIALVAWNAGAAEAEFGSISLTFLETARLSAVCSEHLGNLDPCEALFEYQNLRGGGLKRATDGPRNRGVSRPAGQ
jgi:hypothetical protein